MDTGLAAILSAFISTIIGGALGLASSFLANQQINNQTLRLSIVPRRLAAIEFVGMTAFRALSGETISHDTWELYISNCLWLPGNLRQISLSVLEDKTDSKRIALVQKAIISYIDDYLRSTD